MNVASGYTSARRANAVGYIQGAVPGHGGDVYFVSHGRDQIAVYCYTEFELAPRVPSRWASERVKLASEFGLNVDDEQAERIAWLLDEVRSAGFALQERTANTPWRTESIYDTREEAERAQATLCRNEPVNDDGALVAYRVVERKDG